SVTSSNCCVVGDAPKIGVAMTMSTIRTVMRIASNSLEEAEQQVCERRGEQGAVDDVEHATEAGDEPAGVLHFGIALHEALEQVPELADAADDHAEDEALPPRHVREPAGADHSDDAR